MPKPFSIQVSMSLSIADRRIEEETTQGVALFCSTRIHHPPRQSVRWRVGRCTICQFRLDSEGPPGCFVLYGIRCLFEVHRCHPLVRLPLSAPLGNEFVRHKVVRLFGVVSESCLVGTLAPIKHGEKLVVQHRGERSIQSCGRPQIDLQCSGFVTPPVL